METRIRDELNRLRRLEYCTNPKRRELQKVYFSRWLTKKAKVMAEQMLKERGIQE